MVGAAHNSVSEPRQLDNRGFEAVLDLGCICGLTVAVNFDTGWVLDNFTLTSFKGLNCTASDLGGTMELIIELEVDLGAKTSASHDFL